MHGLTTDRYIVFHGDSGHALRRPRPHGARGHVQPQRRPVPRRSTQQGYSPFSTWTRGLAWAMLGYAEELEFLATLDDADVRAVLSAWTRPTSSRSSSVPPAATCDHYMQRLTRRATASRTGTTARPGWPKLGDWRDRAAEPFNDHEPVDSSAAAIAAQGLIRLGRLPGRRRQAHTRRRG